MHINRLFLFASFAIVRSFFRLFVQYDYHINQCNTSLLNKHRIIYKIMRASLMQQDGRDTDRTQHHSTRHTATHHSRQDYSRSGCGSCTQQTGQQATGTPCTAAMAYWMECRTRTQQSTDTAQQTDQQTKQKKSRPVMVCSFCCAQSLAGASASTAMISSLSAPRCSDSGATHTL